MHQFNVELIKPNDRGCEWRAQVTLESEDIICAIYKVRELFNYSKVVVVKAEQTS